MTDNLPSSAIKPGQQTVNDANNPIKKRSATTWTVSLIAIAVVTGVVFLGPQFLAEPTEAAVAVTPPTVAVSAPVQRDINKRLTLLGQFSAAQQVELRAQVGGTLTKIAFKDGDVVQKGDLLFQIDPTPYQNHFIKTNAALAIARTRLELATIEAARATALKKNGGGTAQNADQKVAEQRAAQAAVDAAKADIGDAQFDLDRTRITAPFTGRIGTHQVSEGNLIAGSRAATSPTTLLATIVSTDSLYLNFDMSESDYLIFQRERQKRNNTLEARVKIALADEKEFNHVGTLDFIDNALDSSSGTIHARATVSNADGLLTPGGFARVLVPIAPASPALLVPDASVLPDQSEHVVLTVGKDNIVTPKQVEIGDLRDGLRVIHSGLEPSDRIIVSGIPIARAGATVTPQDQKIQTATN
ncbi:efflux RND transporter periplasmic adaptor subunit [Ensifer sp. 4252]|uniref:efflux RND transporter periplasmic adaptor subunit n=1 Tax=Ensifer sp. 4252 TaxID=3373915 RepID=UPI003D1B859E